MSQEYYIVCDECRKKVHVGCVGMSGVQFWSKEDSVMANVSLLLSSCFLHLDKLKFVWEQSHEDETYEDITHDT